MKKTSRMYPFMETGRCVWCHLLPKTSGYMMEIVIALDDVIMGVIRNQATIVGQINSGGRFQE